MEKFTLTKRGGIYFQGETDVFSVYKSKNTEIISMETYYPENYDSDEESIETEICWFKDVKHLADLNKTVDWLNENGSCVSKNRDGYYLMSLMCDTDGELDELEIYEEIDPFKREYTFDLSKIEFADESDLSPYNGPIDSYKKSQMAVVKKRDDATDDDSSDSDSDGDSSDSDSEGD